MLEKLAVLVKKGALTERLLYSLLKLFVARTANRRLLRNFDGTKAFELEHPNNPSNT